MIATYSKLEERAVIGKLMGEARDVHLVLMKKAGHWMAARVRAIKNTAKRESGGE